MSETKKHNYVYPQSVWDKAAATEQVYGVICHGWDRERFETERSSIFFAASCPSNATVVDLGCGIGRAARWVAPLVRRYIGLDYAPAMIARARRYNAAIPNVEFLASQTLTVLPNESADLIFSEQVFIHLSREQQLRYLAQACDVLRPGGLLLVAVPHAQHYVNGFEPDELIGLLANFHATADPGGLTFVLRARKPSPFVDPPLEAKRQTITEQFTRRTGYAPNLDHPRTFNEKIQWYKLQYRNPLLTRCADKYEMREYVSQRIGGQYVPKLFGVWDAVEQIDPALLPQAFVLKATHGYKQNIFCPDKLRFDWGTAREKLSTWIQPEHNLYWQSYEWAYKDVPARIICEQYLGENLTDYKLFCFHGRPAFVAVISERATALKVDFYDLDWRRLPFTRQFPVSGTDWPKPRSFDRMLSIAAALAEPFPFVRVDLYDLVMGPLVGELTFYPGNGMEPFTPPEWDRRIGAMLALPPAEATNT